MKSVTLAFLAVVSLSCTKAAPASNTSPVPSSGSRPPPPPPPPGPEKHDPPCRFSPTYTIDEIVKDPTAFEQDVLFWEGHFHQLNVSLNTYNGMTYDGTLIDPVNGTRTAKHPFSAASKEALQIMLYAHAIRGDAGAARFLSPHASQDAPKIAIDYMTKKLAIYQKFNATYPGFGGFLPWFTNYDDHIEPTWDWVNRVPALDNGEMIWAIYAAIEAMESTNNKPYIQLASKWQAYLDYLKTNAAKVFYAGNGNVCTVTSLNQSLPLHDPANNVTCQTPSYLDDPYEGELFTWFLYFFGGLSAKDKQQLWINKRPQLVKVDYDGGKQFGNITVVKGFWYSAHEEWKFLEMPYLDIPLLQRLYRNGQVVRTCNSVVNKIPGMYASVNNSTDVNGQIIGYISNAGIPSIANQTVQELDVITPYSSFTTVLIDKGVGLAWWKNMVDGKKMQNIYGSSESERVDGTATSSFVSWDSKITTVNALLGGVYSIVGDKMKKDGIYNEFIDIATREYELVFGTGKLDGEGLPLCLPSVKEPHTGLQDYTTCHM
ncbi:hypothetical protein BZG36_05205 [Bifiguratus adelaidae]|uniref:Endo-beta-1,2-glucanase SGL domain-containing protein n=1 Tax=Bifiguratus adelaidae TaxID=1938954 RepID=A0A261XTG7_9FUNG|nr:hypothetical protein BZG36_05205 [Bifiguratus adelaidae]